LPQPVQWAVTEMVTWSRRAGGRMAGGQMVGGRMAGGQMAAVRAPMGMRRSSSIWRSSSAERPSVVR
jgi:hypothetical protein